MSRTAVGMVYLQRERYFKQKNTYEYPQKLLINHLIQFTSQLRLEEYEVTLAADINGNSIDRKLAKVI